ncbi:chemotaxis protein : Multi-sensor hybrid histidine kinase OS=Desulfarculus baarsii (strain ATCC 33931 / DSM 2075 / VKM B-1802 / 2st14) GN=Deba_1323 PE=4 SV=1: Response_reg [Gemmataceae bacterium]|jgi:two-component system OmpR family response regulator|nr:chemotaxis protein : Multi-sensor hybrid histidine kinase OS=Desulfarculus baarsii (strain ATCC 33931 / DSM 2075 / VKM B-1802 / 2st14) GN=Deba_1323 PE=4 SV=1: Response_reg [Gemmataceae bacterium]VTU01677.1 chemotaxis protein : Multi-sensor hybrid histidine kinase OS=Desulfarculus baarsii (strain ATCC 33931 / DSM 2075 / VKM B-1802 / 2st14) GN=Deba_1323 PE=4 SV=1: Response_reg [Gemmataceae bacterium]
MNTLLPRGGGANPLSAQSPPCVLVVDDEDALRVVLTRELRKRGFDVYSTGSGAEAVEMYCRSSIRIDVVLMDVNMPGTSGPAALDAILAVDPFVRCCFMTADDRPGRHDALLACGAAAVFGKPFASVKEVCETLKQIAGETFGESDSLIERSAKWRN